VAIWSIGIDVLPSGVARTPLTAIQVAPGLCFTRAQGGDSSCTVTAVISGATQEELDGLDIAAPVAAVR
jgi:hypothetical protein